MRGVFFFAPFLSSFSSMPNSASTVVVAPPPSEQSQTWVTLEAILSPSASGATPRPLIGASAWALGAMTAPILRTRRGSSALSGSRHGRPLWQSACAHGRCARSLRTHTALCENLNHLTLPEVMDFNASGDALCLREFVKRYRQVSAQAWLHVPQKTLIATVMRRALYFWFLGCSCMARDPAADMRSVACGPPALP